MYVCMHACMYACMYVFMYVCICMYVYTYNGVWTVPEYRPVLAGLLKTNIVTIEKEIQNTCRQLSISSNMHHTTHIAQEIFVVLREPKMCR